MERGRLSHRCDERHPAAVDRHQRLRLLPERGHDAASGRRPASGLSRSALVGERPATPISTRRSRAFQALASNSPAADADGLIFVHPGNHIPMNPANRMTLSADYTVTPLWRRRRRPAGAERPIPRRRRVQPGGQAARLRLRRSAYGLQARRPPRVVRRGRQSVRQALLQLRRLSPSWTDCRPISTSPIPAPTVPIRDATLFIGMRAHTD